MPDQNPDQDSDERSILDPGGTNAEGPADSETDAGSAEPHPSTDGASDADASASADDLDELHFDDDDLGEKLRHASDDQLDNAPFGVIKVDDEGTVEFFNRYEAELSGMDPDDVHGRNFFTQVAPCTNNRLFRGRFKKGVRRGELDETFTYTYTYKMRPTLVDVHLYRDEAGNNWITVQKY
jgi:photoactive yellow protein